MATYFLDEKQSLQVLPKNYVVHAKRASYGGELLLVAEPSSEAGRSQEECESVRRKGRVCSVGPLAQLMEVSPLGERKERCKSKNERPGKKKKLTEHPVLKSAKPCPLFAYEADKIPVISLTKNLSSASGTEERKQPKVASIDLGGQRLSQNPHQCSDMQRDLIEQMKQQASKTSSIAATNITLRNPNNFRAVWANSLPRDLERLPDHTVIVRWKWTSSTCCHTMSSVFDLLSNFGTIVGMSQLSLNAGLVLFANVESAVAVVQLVKVGAETSPLICSWWYSKMYRDRFDDKYKVHLYIDREPAPTGERLFEIKFRNIQNRVMTCLKARLPNMSYDYRNFIP